MEIEKVQTVVAPFTHFYDSSLSVTTAPAIHIPRVVHTATYKEAGWYEPVQTKEPNRAVL